MNRRNSRFYARRGMSLVEVMVVIAIVLSLTAILALGVFRAWEDGRVQLTWLTMGKVSEEVVRYELKHRKAPRELSEVYADHRAPNDAWERPLVMTSAPEARWDLVSLGRDGEEGGSGYAADLRWSERPQ